jgi:FkbM family methyltransferase
MSLGSIHKKIKIALKGAINSKSRLWNMLARLDDLLYRLLVRTPPKPPVSSREIISKYSSAQKDIFFIEIGANDGIMDDPIYEFVKRDRWTGILIEPVKRIFEKLVSNYDLCDNLIFENCAIANENGNRDFHYIKQPGNSPSGYEGIGSLLKDKFHADPMVKEQYLTTENVQCITLDTLLEKHNVKKVNVLVIDTEGYDYEIIKTINFSRIRPNIILFEATHLTIDDYKSCTKLLKNSGYALYAEGKDILGLYGVDITNLLHGNGNDL